ncbi:MAG: hypothetical protein QOJ71_1896 [Actinomycetota bacterium]|nr:hypothetical protein [Actinomycetota bacterium]
MLWRVTGERLRAIDPTARRVHDTVLVKFGEVLASVGVRCANAHVRVTSVSPSPRR